MALMISVEETESGNWDWWITDGNGGYLAQKSEEVIYSTREQALAGLFAVFFGTYDNNNYMSLYGEWQTNEFNRTGAVPDS